jgi:hypothetical protein
MTGVATRSLASGDSDSVRRTRNAEPEQLRAARDEYSVHSAAVHPAPSVSAKTMPPDAATGVVKDAIDLFQHSRAALIAELKALDPIAEEYPLPGEWSAPPTGTHISDALAFVDRLNTDAGIPPRTSAWLNKTDPIGQRVIEGLRARGASSGDE